MAGDIRPDPVGTYWMLDTNSLPAAHLWRNRHCVVWLASDAVERDGHPDGHSSPPNKLSRLQLPTDQRPSSADLLPLLAMLCVYDACAADPGFELPLGGKRIPHPEVPVLPCKPDAATGHAQLVARLPSYCKAWVW